MLNLNNLSDQELDELDGKILNETITDEERQAVTAVDEAENALELIVEVDDDPVPPVDNSAPNPPAPVDNQTPPPTPEGTPAPVVSTAVSEDVYNKIIADNPQLAKFKNDENFLTNLSQSYVNLESKIGQPPPQTSAPVITDEQKLADLNKKVLADVEQRMMRDSSVLEALTIRDENGNIQEVLQLPKTPQDLYKFKKDYPAEYLEVKMLGERAYDTVYKEHMNNAQMEVQAPIENQKALDGFLDDVSVYCKKVAKEATPEDLKIVGDTLQAFVAKAVPDGKYYEKKGSAFFLNKRALMADFLADNPELIGKLAEINAKNSVVNNLSNSRNIVQKQRSMKTLANTNLNAPTKRAINLKDPSQIGRLSDEQLDRYEQELLNK